MRITRQNVRLTVWITVLGLLLVGACATALGMLPVATCLTVLLAAHVGVLAFPRECATTQWLGGATFVTALASGGTRALAALGLANAPILLGSLAAITALMTWRVRARGLRPSWSFVRLVDASAGGFGLLFVFASGLTLVTAYLLPVWQYDSLGYHLPFVNFVLQEGSTRAVPEELAYVGTYPHSIEWIFVAIRASLFDDRLIDLAQVPLGLVGAGAVFGVARLLRARPSSAFAAGIAWLVIPAVFLQLPTNYVDVATAATYLLAVYFLLVPPSAASLVTAGMAIGVFLGSKPNAPLATALLGLVVIVRAHQTRHYRAAAVACAMVLALGAESYVTGLLQWGNPVWPVEVHLGFETDGGTVTILHLPGTETMNKVLSSGPATEKVHGSLLARVLESWTRWYATPVFDMRAGGFGPLAVLSIPVAAYFIVRKRAWLLGVLWLGALLSPDPAVCRYVLALPAIALAASAAVLEGASARARFATLWACAALALVSLGHAAGGLHGEGPPLTAYVSMTRQEREVAVGADGRPERFIEMRNRLAEGDAIAFDKSLDLPYLLWRPDLSTRAIYLRRGTTNSELEELIVRERIRFVVIADDSDLVSSMGDRLNFLFLCKSAPCNGYEVR